MPHWTTRSNLSAAQFPFATPWMGRSIILPQYDQNYDRSVVSVTDGDKDKGIPQVFYMHNVLPTAQGFQSIGYSAQINASTSLLPAFDGAFLLRNSVEDRFIYSPGVGDAGLKNNVYDPYIGVWREYASAALVSDPLITTAYINNQTYIFVEKTGCYQYNKATPGMSGVVLTGLTVADIIGITSANGYLIAWSATETFWSSTVDPTDFTPSLSTGAGSGFVNDIKGPISFCLQISGGFIAYTERNAVAANYTGNIRYPFAFKEVVNSGGVTNIQDVTSDTSSAEHYALTTSGLQKIDRQTASSINADLTDFLTANLFEDFDEATCVFTTEYLASPVIHKIAICANRYLVISYGKIAYTHALVLDTVMKRWGKLRITHVDCFDYFAPEAFAAPITDQMKGSVGFLKADGSISTINFASGAADSNGAFVIGKFQFLRNSMIELIGFNWECANPNGVFSAWILPSIDGTNFGTPVAASLVANTGRLRSYGGRCTGRNVSLAVVGSFNLVSNQIEFLKAGDR